MRRKRNPDHPVDACLHADTAVLSFHNQAASALSCLLSRSECGRRRHVAADAETRATTICLQRRVV